MKRLLSVLVALAFVSPALAQEENGDAAAPAATATSTETVDTLDELWSFQDAVPVPQGMVDLRLSTGWQTGTMVGNGGDSDDDFVFTPSLVWGFAENWEASIRVPIWLFDGGDAYGGWEDGNYDTWLGAVWGFASQDDGSWADMAIAGNFRIPTGYKSSGVDYEGRFMMTHNYDSGLRAHFNAWGQVNNGTNYDTSKANRSAQGTADLPVIDTLFGSDTTTTRRPFTYGGSLGVDFPLCHDGDVRMVVNYAPRTSVSRGNKWWHILETGWEWKLSDSDRIGLSGFYNMDKGSDAPRGGATITWAHALAY